MVSKLWFMCREIEINSYKMQEKTIESLQIDFIREENNYTKDIM
ncbi:hypothetical protein [Bacillus cereus]